MTDASPPPSRSWALPLALAAFAVATSWIALTVFRLNDGHFTYAQDDPYIHLSLARTLASSGVWGLSPDAFAGASSSPLWTVILAALMVAGGQHVWWPLVVNLIAAVLLLAYVDARLRPRLSEPARATALLVFLFVLPLPTLVFVGMEHILHALCVVALCGAAADRLSDAGAGDRPWPAGMLLAFMAAGLRYEGMFVVATIVLLMALRRRWLTAVSVAAAGVVPLVAYAIYAAVQGGFLLPNSVVIKSGASQFGSGAGLLSILGKWVGVFSIYERPPQLALLVLAAAVGAFLAGRGRPLWNVPHLLLSMFVGVGLLHVCLVAIEWFYRYEAYVIAIGMLAISTGMAELWPSWREAWARATQVRRVAIAVAAFLLCFPLFVRGATALAQAPLATGEIYRQQYQMGRFFQHHYAGRTVAINDIGAVSWMASVQVLDLIGLATEEIARAKRVGAIDAAFMQALAAREGVSAIAIYEWHFRATGTLPDAWFTVGEWSIPSAIAVAGPTVTFLAPSPDSAARLGEALDAYAELLPSDVTYVKGESLEQRVEQIDGRHRDSAQRLVDPPQVDRGTAANQEQEHTSGDDNGYEQQAAFAGGPGRAHDVVLVSGLEGPVYTRQLSRGAP